MAFRNLNSKSQGISLNTIIIAAIALIVLVVLVAIFTGRMGIFIKETDKCKGICYDTKEQCSGTYDKVDESGACSLDPQGENPDRKPGIGAKYGYCCISVS